MSLALLAALATTGTPAQEHFGLHADVGLAASSEHVAEVESHLRVHVAVESRLLTAGLLFERYVGSLGGAHSTEGCNEIGADQGGCMRNPTLVGGEIAVHPFRRWLEPSAFLTGVWAHRDVVKQTSSRGDLGLGGGVAVDLRLESFSVGLWARYLNYVTYSPQCCGNESAVTLGVRVGWTSVSFGR